MHLRTIAEAGVWVKAAHSVPRCARDNCGSASLILVACLGAPEIIMVPQLLFWWLVLCMFYHQCHWNNADSVKPTSVFFVISHHWSPFLMFDALSSENVIIEKSRRCTDAILKRSNAPADGRAIWKELGSLLISRLPGFKIKLWVLLQLRFWTGFSSKPYKTSNSAYRWRMWSRNII